MYPFQIREAVQTATIANTMTSISFGTERICGRVFSTIAETAAIAYAAGRSICCKFQILNDQMYWCI